MEMRRLERNRLLMALLTCALGACARDVAPVPRTSGSIVTDVIIQVNNAASRDKAIFLEARAQEHRLGTVRGHSSRSFSVPSGAGDSTGTLRLEARELAYPTVRSGAFRLAPGDRVVWTLDRTGRAFALTL